MPGPADTYIAYGQGWANISNTPFRLYKHWEHEGGIATPLIAHWPRGIDRQGQLEHQPGHLIDIMATCVDLAAADYPVEKAGATLTPLEGRSLTPVFAGRTIDREAIYWEHEGNRAIRMGKWKLVAKGPAGPWELYDLDADRSETNDLAAANPQQVRLMVEKWEAWAKRANVLPWIWKPPYGQPAAAATNPSRKLFVLKSGETLTGDEVPAVKGKGLTLTAKIEQWGDGVVVAQGGTAHGYSLYVQQGRLHYVARINNTLHALAAQGKAQGNEVTATLTRDGTVTLAVDGKELARGKFPQTLAKTPVDGLSVSADSNAPVGDYEAPFEFKGKLREVRVEIKD
jgi:arylsulfatase